MSSMEWNEQVSAAILETLDEDIHQQSNIVSSTIVTNTPVSLQSAIYSIQKQAQAELPSSVTDLYALMLYGEPTRPPPPPPTVTSSSSSSSITLSSNHNRTSSMINDMSMVPPPMINDNLSPKLSNSPKIEYSLTTSDSGTSKTVGTPTNTDSTILSTSLPSIPTPLRNLSSHTSSSPPTPPPSHSLSAYASFRLNAAPQLIPNSFIESAHKTSSSLSPLRNQKCIENQIELTTKFYRWLVVNTDSFAHVERV